MKLFNLTDSPQPVLAIDGSSHTVPAHDSAEVPDVDAKYLARELPERFALHAPKETHPKKHKKES